MSLEHIKNWFANKFSFGEKRMVFAVTEDGGMANENLDKMEKKIYEILEGKIRTEEEQKVFEMLEQKGKGEQIQENMILKSYFDSFVARIERGQEFGESEKRFLRQFTASDFRKIPYPDHEGWKIRYVYDSVYEKADWNKVFSEIQKIRDQLATVLKGKNLGEEVKIPEIYSVGQYFKLLKEDIAFEKRVKEEFPTTMELQERWGDFEDHVADFLENLLPSEHIRKFMKYLRAFPNDVRADLKDLAKKDISNGPASVQAFPLAMQYYLQENEIIGVTYEGVLHRDGYNELLAERVDLANFGHIRDAMSAKEIDAETLGKDIKVKLEMGIIAAIQNLEAVKKAKGKKPSVISLDKKTAFMAGLTRQNLDKEFQQLTSGRQTLSKKDIPSLRENLGKERDKLERKKLSLARRKEQEVDDSKKFSSELLEKLTYRPEAKYLDPDQISFDSDTPSLMQDIFKFGLSCRESSSREELNQRFGALLQERDLTEGDSEVISEFKERYQDISEFINEDSFDGVAFDSDKFLGSIKNYSDSGRGRHYDNVRSLLQQYILPNAEIFVKQIEGITDPDDIKKQYKLFLKSLESQKISGLLKQIKDSFAVSQVDDADGFIQRMRGIFDGAIEPIEGEIDADKVRLNLQKFDRSLHDYQQGLIQDADEWKRSRGFLKNMDAEIDEVRKQELVIQKQLRALDAITDEMDLSEEDKGILYFEKLQSELKQTEIKESDDSQEEVIKRMWRRNLIEQNKERFKKMGVDLDKDFGEDKGQAIAFMSKAIADNNSQGEKVRQDLEARAVSTSKSFIEARRKGLIGLTYEAALEKPENFKKRIMATTDPAERSKLFFKKFKEIQDSNSDDSNALEKYAGIFQLYKRKENARNILKKSKEVKKAKDHKYDFCQRGHETQALVSKIESDSASIKIRFQNRNSLSLALKKHLGIEGAYNNSTTQRIKDVNRAEAAINASSPLGFQMPNQDDTGYEIIVFEDYEEVLKARKLNLDTDKQEVDAMLADFLSEELHHVRQDQMKDEFEKRADEVIVDNEFGQLENLFNVFYGISNPQVEDVSAQAVRRRGIIKEIDAQEAINTGRNYSTEYGEIINLFRKICERNNIDFDIFRKQNEVSDKLSRIAANHQNGANGKSILAGAKAGLDDDEPEEKKPEKDKSPAEKKADMLAEINRILEKVKSGSDVKKLYYLNLDRLKQRIKEAGAKYDSSNFDKAGDDLEAIKNRLNAFDANSNDPVTISAFKNFEKEFNTPISFLKKIDEQIENFEAISIPDVPFFKDLWVNTRFLSIHTCGKIFSEAWQHVKEDHETLDNFRAHTVGGDIGGSSAYGSKQRAKVQSDENGKVHEWMEMFKGMDEGEVQDLLWDCRDEFQLKAILEYKAEHIGDLNFGHKAVWQAIEQTLGARIYSQTQAEYAYNKRYGKNATVELRKTAKSKYLSKANEFKDLVRAEQNQMFIWEEGVEKIEHAIHSGQRPPWVDSMHYEGAFRYSIDDGKSTPQKCFYYFYKGYELGILTEDTLMTLSQEKLNDFPPIENAMNVIDQDKKRVEFKPPERIARYMEEKGYHYQTELEFICALKPFAHGNAQYPDYLIWQWWMSGDRLCESDKAAERLNKAFGRFKGPADPDWSEEILWHITERDFKTGMNRREDASDKISTNCISNCYKQLIFYSGMMDDKYFEKILLKFVNIDRYIFEESFKNEGGKVVLDSANNPIQTAETKPGYWRDELNVKSVMPPSIQLGAYRYAIFEGFKAYARAGKGHKGVLAARKKMIEYGIGLGVLGDSSEEEQYMQTTWGHEAGGAEIVSAFRAGKTNKEALKREVMQNYQGMPLTHFVKDEKGQALVDDLGLETYNKAIK